MTKELGHPVLNFGAIVRVGFVRARVSCAIDVTEYWDVVKVKFVYVDLLCLLMLHKLGHSSHK